MMKKLSAMLLCLLLCMVCAWGAAEYTFDFDTDDYAITGCGGTDTQVTVPDEISGCPVEIINSSVFYGNTQIASLTLPRTLLTLGSSNIYGMDALEQIALPDTLTAIGDNNFYFCPLLTSVSIPARVSYIGSYSFYSCENLREIWFEGVPPHIQTDSFVYLADGAVAYVPQDQIDAYRAVLPEELEIVSSGKDAVICDYTAPESEFTFDADTGTIMSYLGFGVRVDIPSQIGGVPVRAIGDEAFYGHSYLYDVTIPEGVETIGNQAFASAWNLGHVTLPSTLRHIGERAFSGYRGTVLRLPEGLRTIGNGAFYWSQAQEIYFPQGIESIADEAFYGAYVHYLYFDGELPQIAPTAFDGTSISDVDLNWQASKEQMQTAQAFFDGIGQQARVWRMQNPNVDYIRDGLDTYEDGVLTGYTGTQTHIRPWDTYDDETVTAVGEGAFRDNKTIVSFAVPYNDAFTDIGAYAFAGSTVERVDLFDSVTVIGEGAFSGCENLTELIIPASVTQVGAGALEGCINLKKLTVLCDPMVLPEGFAAGCGALEQVYGPADAAREQLDWLSRAAGLPWYRSASRAGEAMEEIASMPYEELPGSDFWYDADMARIDNYQGYALNLVLPRSVDGHELTMIGGSMMQRACQGDNFDIELPVCSVVIPETYREIPYYAFADCKTLETFVCYAPIETLPEGVFSGCTNLREVIFAGGVHNLDRYIFADCPSLETVYLGGHVGEVSEFAFLNFDGSEAFDADRCITDRAQMPDVDALLAAVRRDPMPAPTPEPEPEIMEPMPVGEEGAPYFGTWKLVSIEAEDVVLSAADMGMVMDLTFREDGTVSMWDGEMEDLALWLVAGDSAVVADETVTIDENGGLIMESDGLRMCFVREEAQAAAHAPQSARAAEPAPAQTGEAADPKERLERKYLCTSYTAMGAELDAATLGAEYSVIFHENGTADLCLSGVPMNSLPWGLEQIAVGLGRVDAFVINYYGTMFNAVLTDTGFDMDYYGAMTLHFEQAD